MASRGAWTRDRGDPTTRRRRRARDAGAGDAMMRFSGVRERDAGFEWND